MASLAPDMKAFPAPLFLFLEKSDCQLLLWSRTEFYPCWIHVILSFFKNFLQPPVSSIQNPHVPKYWVQYTEGFWPADCDSQEEGCEQQVAGEIATSQFSPYC